MAKVILNEEKLEKIVENATRRCIQKIINEGAGGETLKSFLKRGYNDDNSDEDFKQWAKDFNKDGLGKVKSYDNYLSNKKRYKDLKGQQMSDKAITGGKNKNLNNDVIDAAEETVASRKGALGKLDRTMATTAAKIGRTARKGVEGAKNFVHDKIGLEEE